MVNTVIFPSDFYNKQLMNTRIRRIILKTETGILFR